MYRCREAYLDGNDFGCAGTEKLLLALVDKAETEMNDKRIAEEEKLAAEEAARIAAGRLNGSSK